MDHVRNRWTKKGQHAVFREKVRTNMPAGRGGNEKKETMERASKKHSGKEKSSGKGEPTKGRGLWGNSELIEKTHKAV